MEETQANPTASPKRGFRIACAIGAVVITVWQIVSTELRVADLRERGFGDVVISSERNHAYFPMIGAFLGAFLFLGIAILIRRALRPRED